MKLSKDSIEQFDKTWRYLSDNDLFPKEVKIGKGKNTRKGCIKANNPVPETKAMPGIPDEHGSRTVSKPDGKAKIRKVRRKRYG